MSEIKRTELTSASLEANRKDVIRIKKEVVSLDLTLISGKADEYYVAILPNINVSGYGRTEEEAMEALDLDVKTFCEDVLAMKVNERNDYLSSLGFSPIKYHSKNFSKAFVDDNGILQNLEPGTVKKQLLQVA